MSETKTKIARLESELGRKDIGPRQKQIIKLLLKKMRQLQTIG